ncbi:tetratricopeptide repeat protein [Microbacterium sp. zg.Y1090]|uniref:tetratricopeptide repeat protein n=1 Tax=Microbacterium TaxID=33882 RepID=UPI00214B17C1|nr:MULTISPECIES: tetratricopeptide repeat protein [unclassified Microbacterium]MCR2811659.1 tetratricopeptide repeat protein [Microbacterium sp. zg.Y1084]MCR2818903.1 tetratricopeptide repeat protein [Microbacterium sp. zg.Y1090]MDL5486994.1 tetratricopeptide repeat protein [Microbacterium sp. zg-Y1211]WIM27212.1 tetratricopeptide repeat protein [Microbacterium sp. zg-Y1090]
MTDPTTSAVLRGAVDLSSLRNRPQPPAGGAAASGAAASDAPTVPSLVMDVTDATFGAVLELSRTVPVVVDLWAEWCGPCKQLSPVLEKVVTELGGRLVLAKVDVDANPQLAQGFRAQSIPMVVALVAGQPVPLFTGAVPEAQVREVFAQLLQLAAQNGVTGTVDAGAPAAEEEEPQIPPLHAEAFDAIEAGDYARAVSAYERALAEDPHDEDARAGLGQVRLLARVQGLDLQAARAAAAAAPRDVAAQFAVADLDLAGGHVEDAFLRLLELFQALPTDERAPVRERLLELFGLVGDADPRVLQARRSLASLMF